MPLDPVARAWIHDIPGFSYKAAASLPSVGKIAAALRHLGTPFRSKWSVSALHCVVIFAVVCARGDVMEAALQG